MVTGSRVREGLGRVLVLGLTEFGGLAVSTHASGNPSAGAADATVPAVYRRVDENGGTTSHC